jgi:DNA-binding HxlR family transcriptional regulator
VLTERIRALECAGLVERLYLPPPAASFVYVLTSAAAGLKPVLAALARWHAEAGHKILHSDSSQTISEIRDFQ